MWRNFIGRLIGFLAAVLVAFAAVGQPALASVAAPAVECCSVAPSPERFIDIGGTIMDRASIRTSVSSKRQGRHLAGDPLFNGGGYFDSIDDSQSVLNAFHAGSANALGVSRQGHVDVEVPSITGFNNNQLAGFIDQPTNVFLIKDSSSPSIVPTKPLRTAGS